MSREAYVRICGSHRGEIPPGYSTVNFGGHNFITYIVRICKESEGSVNLIPKKIKYCRYILFEKYYQNRWFTYFINRLSIF